MINNSMSLLHNHNCSSDHIPVKKIVSLDLHKDEVWFVKFSNNGRYLASASKNKTVIFWEIKKDEHTKTLSVDAVNKFKAHINEI
jgi:WD40 repeat protein